MKNLKKSFSFLDKEGKRARIKAEITTRNGYSEFIASGTYQGSGGQSLGRIKPATNRQAEFIELWKKYHLKDISKIHGFDENLIGIIEVIHFEEEKREKEKEEKEGDEKILEIINEEGINENMLDACRAYLANFPGNSLDLSNFEEAYYGEYSNDADFARAMAEEVGAVDKNAKWPNNCINWEQASRELMLDYFESNGFYFRNL